MHLAALRLLHVGAPPPPPTPQRLDASPPHTHARPRTRMTAHTCTALLYCTGAHKPGVPHGSGAAGRHRPAAPGRLRQVRPRPVMHARQGARAARRPHLLAKPKLSLPYRVTLCSYEAPSAPHSSFDPPTQHPRTPCRSYEAPNDPDFRSTRLSLIDRGFTFAIAHVRGGGECVEPMHAPAGGGGGGVLARCARAWGWRVACTRGWGVACTRLRPRPTHPPHPTTHPPTHPPPGEMGRRWYEDGKYLKKRNTFTDFVACAEHLVSGRYTSPPRLCIEGRSGGWGGGRGGAEWAGRSGGWASG